MSPPTRNASPEQPSTAYQDANHVLNSLHRDRASRSSSVLLSTPTPNAGTTRTLPRCISINQSPHTLLQLKRPLCTFHHPSRQENPGEQLEKDLVTKQYEEINRYVAFNNDMTLCHLLKYWLTQGSWNAHAQTSRATPSTRNGLITWRRGRRQ